MTIKALYNVGMIKIGDTQKTLYLGSADGQNFLFIRDGQIFSYITADMLRSFMALQLAVIDSRLQVFNADNTLAPTYTVQPAAGKTYRSVAVTNATDAMPENYTGQPFYTLKGDGVLDYAGGTSAVDANNLLATLNADAAATSPTGIAILDNLWAFVMANWVYLLVGFVALAYLGIFDPLHLFGKKKKKAKK